MATVPQYFRDLYPTPCENAPAPHTIKNFLKKIDQRSYEGKVQELWDYLAGEFTGSLEPLEPFSEHIRKGGEFSDYQNFPLDRIRYEGPQGTTRSYSGSSFCEKYTKRRSEHGVEDYLKRHKPDLVFAASRAHEQSTKRDKKRRKPNDQPDQSTHSKTSKFYQDFELESNEYLDSILSLVFELKGRRELPSKPFLQEAVYLIASYDACGCYLGGFAVGKEFACMVVINKETILFEVPEDTHLTTLGIDDMMAFLAHDFSFPHAFSDDAEDLDFIWRYFNIAWDAIKDLPFGRRLPRVPQPPWLSREGVGEKLDIPLVELGGVHERLADFLKHVHRVKPKTATTSSSNVLSGNLDSVPTASRPRSQSPPRQYDLQGEASSSLTPISNLEQEEEMSNVDDEDGADEEHDEEEEDDDGSDNPNPDSTGNGKKDDPGDDPSGNLGGSGDGADPGMGGGKIGVLPNTTELTPAPGDGGSAVRQQG
ncbi:hypothetical protein L202_01852 [Cryptococcus amylolentus CBS 6039]|uniref:Uncharacterized protein n=1 Tax=Cryptococcus amylolentus CBS 6039 TaxID=1295533 RepID=A0A1E3I523_9TREE|nr:hypothetical protein L202_01852 [Cryptococcus amylolentus CBS 6039]ODN83763.1 hypothetical protein L202_01852 [Cryptococcus amylolentus CBS 6039]